MKSLLLTVGFGSLAVAALLFWGLIFYIAAPLIVAAWANGGEWRIGALIMGFALVGLLALVFAGPPGYRPRTPYSPRPWFTR